jgi:hypothetical protein
MIKKTLRLIGFALTISALYYLATQRGLLFGELWKAVHFTSLQLIQPALERYIAVWLWDPVLLNIILTPAWIVLFVLAIPFLYGGLKR